MDGIRRDALSIAQRLLHDYPDSPDALSVFGLIQGRFGNRLHAVRCWQRCLELGPDNADACHCLGEDALQRGNHEEAVRWLGRALKSEPERASAFLSLGNALSKAGRMNEAVEAYRKHHELAPESAEGCFRLAQALMHLKEYTAAKKYHEAALRLDPDCKPAYFGLARACDRLGQSEEAEKNRREFAVREARDRLPAEGRRTRYDDTVEMRKSLADSCDAAAKAYAAHGNLPQAEVLWRKAVAACPERPEPRLTLVALYEHQQRWQDAVRELEVMRPAAPNQSLHGVKIGSLHVKGGQLDQAEDAFRKAIQLAPARPEGYVALAQLCLHPGRDPAQAKEAAQSAVRLEPSAVNYFLLGLACERCGDEAEAETALGRASELDPANLRYRQAHAALQARRASIAPPSVSGKAR